jgi:hypothetical protein
MNKSSAYNFSILALFTINFFLPSPPFGISLIIRAFFILYMFTYIGIVFFKLIYRYKINNWLIIISGGMITAPLVFLFLLNILSYIFKGQFFQILLFILVYLLSAYLDNKYKLQVISDIVHPKISNKKVTFWIILILLIHIILIFTLVEKAKTGGDVLQYWSLSTSFARGNYPTVMPWQPNFLTVYHTGTFIILGFLKTVMQLPIDRVHFFFVFYILAGAFLFVTGIALKKYYSLISIFPAIFGFILIGLPTILIKFADKLNPLVNIMNLFTRYPLFAMSIRNVGAGASSLEMLSYIIFESFGWALFLLFLYSLINRNSKKPIRDYLIIILLLILSLTVNEVFFLVEFILLAGCFIKDYSKISVKKLFVHGIFLTSLFILLFFIFQNSTRDSLFTPATEAPRYKIVMPALTNIRNLLLPVPYESLQISLSNGMTWYLVDVRILIVIGLILSLISAEYIPFAFSLAALVSLLYSVFIYITYDPWDVIRFYTQAYKMMAFAFGFLLVVMFKKKKIIQIICEIILLLLLPQLLSSYQNIFSVINTSDKLNYTIGEGDHTNPDLFKLTELIPIDKRVLIINFLPDGTLEPQLSVNALSWYGLMVPMGPPYTKILGVSTGMEWYDAVFYMDPVSFKQLGVQYLYINGVSSKFLPKQRTNLLNNSNYFQKITGTKAGALYRVLDNYTNLSYSTDPLLRRMIDLIERNKTVYIDKLYYHYRRAIFLELHKKNIKFIGTAYGIGNDYYLTIEILSPVIIDTPGIHSIDYVIMNPKIKPYTKIYGKYQKIMITRYADLWKRID